MGDELCLDNEKIGANEEDSSINIVSDGEAIGFPMSPHNERQTDVFQSNKIQNVGRGCPRESAQGSKLCILMIFLRASKFKFCMHFSFVFKFIYHKDAPPFCVDISNNCHIQGSICHH